MPHGLPRCAQAGVAAGLVLAFLATASSPALADAVRSQEWWLRTLHVTRAWRSTKGAGVTVAVLDTGVDAKQADLAGSVVTGPDYTHSGRTPNGPYWGVHGTAVASIIAGHGHGAGGTRGIAGVAPAARILSVRVTLEANDPLLPTAAIAGGLPNAIARGIRYAVRQHAAVIDLPLDPVTTPGAAGSGGSPGERAAVAYALARHVVLVAPAGDDGSGADAVNYPAAYPGVISVGAFNEKFIKATYSSSRAYVTLTAAGDGVTAASGITGYAQLHSTSAASAVVAGIVALIRAQFPKLTPAQVRQVLTTSTVFRPRGGRGDGSGYGTVDATAALMAASKLVEAVPSAAASAGAVAAQAPPSAPAVHSTVVSKNLGHSLITDAGIAVAVFLVLLGCILGFTTGRRRRARSARLAEVRAATRVPARKTAKTGAAPPAGASTDTVNSAVAGTSAVAGNSAWPPGSNSVAGAGMPGAAMPGAGLAGAGIAGAAMTGAGPAGAGFTGAGLSGTWRPVPAGAQDGVPGRATPQPQVEPVGFVPAPLAPGADLSGFTPGGEPDGPVPGGPVPPGMTPGSPVAATGTPPWARIQEDPSARFRGQGSAAIPESAFPGSAASAAAPDGGPGGADGGRASGRRAQGSHRGSPSRAPRVSGTPPWEPAPEPDSELPWTQAPAPPRGGAALPHRQPTRATTPTWEAIAEEAWPGGPSAGRPRPPAGSPPDGGQQQTDRPSYSWTPGAADEPSRTAQPEADSWLPRSAQPRRIAGFVRGAQPASAQPASAQPASAQPADIQPASPQPADIQPASPQPAGIQPADIQPAGAAQPPGRFGFLRGGRPATALQPPGNGPDAGPVPPGAIPGGGSTAAEGTGPGGSAPSGAPWAGPEWAGSAQPGTGQPGTGQPGTGQADRRPIGADRAGAGPANPGPANLGPANPGPANPGPANPGPAGTPKGGVPPWEITDSFLAIRTEAPGPALGTGPSPAGPGAPGVPPEPTGSPRDSASFPTSQAESPGFPRSGASFPTSQAESPGFPRGGASSSPGDTPSLFRRPPSFPTTPAEPPGLSRGGAPFPTTPAQPPSFPRDGNSFPAGPAGAPGSPSAATPGDGSERTESFPAVPPSGDGRLPRRIPLSERGGTYPPAAPRSDNDAYRLFPFGKDTDPPPGQNND